VLLAALGCRSASEAPGSRLPAPVAGSRAPEPGSRSSGGLLPFTNVAAPGGIAFRHATGGTGALTLLQTTGSGCSLFDFDNDGWLDLFLVGSARAGAGASVHALYRNNGDSSFTDVTKAAGLENNGYGMGSVAADYDGDGDLDLLITSYGANTLYRNNGRGQFEDVTAASGLAPATNGERRKPILWNTSAAFADYDGDGWLDLYVARYLQFDDDTPQICRHQGVPLACMPTLYDPQYGSLYRNNGDGTFTDVTRQAGAVSAGRSLGAVWCDCDGDGRSDLFVANDTTPNNLFHNEGGGRFSDVAVAMGLAYGPHGSPEASMGVDFGDYDGDGRFDLLVTNFQNEGAGLYHNGGKPGFFAAADRAGVLAATLPVLGFGAGFLDFDNDGRPDLFMANGHVQEAIQKVDPACSFAQPRQIFRNRGDGTFEDLTSACGPAMTEPAVGRGAAFGDYDNDGDLDILVNNNGGPAMLLRNNLVSTGTGAERPERTPHWLRLRLVGRAPNRFAVGARVTIWAGGLRQVREVRAGHSFASSSDIRLQFGLGRASRADRIVVRWPGGGRSAASRRTTLVDVAADQEVTFREPG
jgi:hypothetical protein